ncbi:MAG TPA: sugar ABC transporter permease [Clostridiales bacterium]|jgi:multiple sugar transport system permease protein|nr:sugar ABC transporter permease [Clostridiales bacterium]
MTAYSRKVEMSSKPAAKRPSKQQKHFTKLGLLFVSPWIIGFLLFSVYPIASAVYYSLTEYNIFQPPQFVGIKNYIDLFTNRYFPISLGNTMYMAFIGLPIGLVVALMLALLLSHEMKGMAFFRTVYYLPTVVPIVASAMLFIWLLNGDYGLLNEGLRRIGIKGPNWLSNPSTTKMSLILMDTWRCGQSMIIFLSALKAIPRSFYEAAELDGAGPVRRFFSITLPYIGPTIQFNLVIGLIASFQYFTQAFIFSSVTSIGSGYQTIGGGPRNSLLFYSLELYRQAFSYLKMGYACAMAIVLFLIVLVVTMLAMWMMERRISYDVE